MFIAIRFDEIMGNQFNSVVSINPNDFSDCCNMVKEPEGFYLNSIYNKNLIIHIFDNNSPSTEVTAFMFWIWVNPEVSEISNNDHQENYFHSSWGNHTFMNL